MKPRSTGRKQRTLPLHRVYCSNCRWRGRTRMQPLGAGGIRLDVSGQACGACGHQTVCIDISPLRYRSGLRIRSTTYFPPGVTPPGVT